MTLEALRNYCLSLPHATETIQWGESLVFKVGGKVFAVAATEPGPVRLSFKCTPEEFAELTERPGIVQAPYFARTHWAALETLDALAAPELRRRLRESYDLVFAGLPRKTRVSLGSS